MSRQSRNRVTATALGGFVLGAALLATGTADAGQVEGGGRQVVFLGDGTRGLPCGSTPSAESVTVPADGTVVNRTGRGARPRLDGTPGGSIPDDGSTDVVFRSGTTAVLLSPNCTLGAESTPVLVTASPSASATTMPDPTPAPSGGSAGPASPSNPGSPSASDGATTMPDSATPTSRPQTPGATRPRSPCRWSAAERPPGAHPAPPPRAGVGPAVPSNSPSYGRSSGHVDKREQRCRGGSAAWQENPSSIR